MAYHRSGQLRSRTQIRHRRSVHSRFQSVGYAPGAEIIFNEHSAGQPSWQSLSGNWQQSFAKGPKYLNVISFAKNTSTSEISLACCEE
jgi:hypothetical protein